MVGEEIRRKKKNYREDIEEEGEGNKRDVPWSESPNMELIAGE